MHIKPAHLALPSGRQACGNDFATQSAPAHYTAHHLHITWTDSTHWSFSGLSQYSEGLLIETIKQLSCKDSFKRSELYYSRRAAGVYLSSSLCSFVVSVQSALRKVSNQRLCMLFTSFFFLQLLLWLLLKSSPPAGAPWLIRLLLFDQTCSLYVTSLNIINPLLCL